MARGGDDYKAGTGLYGQGLTDVAELAARMNSPDLLDRRGTVFFQDDFSNLLYNWQVLVLGTSTVDVWASQTFQSGMVVRMLPDPINVNRCWISKFIPTLAKRKLGIECMIRLGYDDVNPPSDFKVSYAYFDGVNAYTYAILFDALTNTLQYLTDVGGVATYNILVPATGKIYLGGSSNYYNYVKLVIDLEKGAYDRYVLNEKGGTMRTFTPFASANTVAPHLEAAIVAQGHPPAQYCDVANVILTMDEP